MNTNSSTISKIDEHIGEEDDDDDEQSDDDDDEYEEEESDNEEKIEEEKKITSEFMTGTIKNAINRYCTLFFGLKEYNKRAKINIKKTRETIQNLEKE